MNKYLLLFICMLFTYACTTEQKDNTHPISKSQLNAIDSLAHRYLALGRFSGTLLIQKEGNIVYAESFGLADYAANKEFSADSQFKINTADLKEAGLQVTSDPNNKSTKHLAMGYLYHNYRGKGLELEAVAIPHVPGSEQTVKVVSAKDLGQLVHSQPKAAIDFSGFLPSDGFSYAVRYNPANQTTIVVLSNRRHPVADEMVSSLEAILEGKAYQLPLPRRPYAIDPTKLTEYAGNYALNEQVKFEVVKNQDSLFVYLGPNQVRLIPQSNDQFYMMETDAAMRFLRDASGTVNRVILLNGFITSDQIAYRDN